VAICLATTVLPVLVLAWSPVTAAAAETHPARVPQCPPDCGAVAAGDPLLVPFIVQNPGADWQAYPAAESQSYVDNLRRNLDRLSGSHRANAAVARWRWVTGQYGLLIALVSSDSIPGVHLANPTGDAADLCSSAGGVPIGSPKPIPGAPRSAWGLCQLRPGSPNKLATVAAFVRGNVATLIQITSRSSQPISQRVAAQAAYLQYAALPAGGVPVSSNGLDWTWVLVWLLLLAAVVVVSVRSARRRGTWRGPFEAVTESARRRGVALGVSLVAVVGATAFTMFDSTVMRGFGEWWGVASFGDFWQNWADAAYTTFAGGYGHLYVLDRSLETPPALQVLTAPIARAAFGLHFPYPSAVLYPSAFWVAGPLFLSTMVLPICAADRWLSGMGVSDLRRRLLVLGVMGIALPPIALSGHPEGLIALGAMLYGIIAAFENRTWATGWWLGFALAFQPFAFLGVPIAFIFLKRRAWLTALVPMILVPLAFLAVPLATEPASTVRQLLHQQVYDVFGYISPTWNFSPGVAAYVRAGVALVAIPAAVILARFVPPSRRQGAAVVVWTLALLFSFRVFEPELFPYFMAPTLALFPIGASRLPWWRLVSVSVLAVWITYWLHVAIRAEWSLWLILVAQLCLLGGLSFPGRQLRPSTEPPPAASSPDERSGGRVLASR
ncbi:MAG TPA: hypothetical protein VHW93_10180, partial [Acidimicrobiales bacterium]|jgi:hypothetical protein|nr:hypothetical protein [Acidimicrobiales bacterium]